MFTYLFYINFIILLLLYIISASNLYSYSTKNLKKNGLWSCTDDQQCLSLTDCSKKQAEYRAGYLCNNYPWYNGGPPILSGPDFDNLETIILNCTHNFGTGCDHMNYQNTLYQHKQLLIGSCHCISILNNYVCKEWICLDYSMNSCSDNNAYDCGNYVDIGSNSGFYDQCCKDDLNDGIIYYKNKHVSNTSRECNCIETQQNFVFQSQEKVSTCTKWDCITQTTGHPRTTKQYQYNTCDQLSVSRGYCKLYHTVIDSIDYFANADCQCISIGKQYIGGDNYWEYCQQYECKQQGMNKYQPDLLWILAGVLLGGPCLLRCLSTWILHRTTLDYLGFYSVTISLSIIHIGIIFVTTIMGGIGSLIVAEGINILLAILLLCYLFYIRYKEQCNNHGDVPIYYDDEDLEEDLLDNNEIVIDENDIDKSVKIKNRRNNILDIFSHNDQEKTDE